jgi:peptidoglycan hydrolase-like protein with peptidoglycan-binding domain
MKMKIYKVAAILLMVASMPVHAAFAQYPGESGSDPAINYDPVGSMAYDRQFGMPNDIVRQAQETLRDQGYYHGPLDGVRNPQYLAAIWNFQRAKGLPTTTHLDGPTLAALDVPATGAASPRLTAPSDFADPAAASHLDDVEAP